MNMTCMHEKVRVVRTEPFFHPVSQDSVVAAHGGVTETLECRCGSRRLVNVNGAHLEYGDWYPYKAMLQAANDRVRLARGIVGEVRRVGPVDVWVDSEGYICLGGTAAVRSGPDPETYASIAVASGLVPAARELRLALQALNVL